MGTRGTLPSATEAESIDTTSGTRSPGGTTWPKVEELLAIQQKLEDEDLLWLATCKELAKRQLPRGIYEFVPDEIWRFAHWGSKCVIMRTPQVEQQGLIAIPKDAQKPNELGWILTVGDKFCGTDEANVRGRECPYGRMGWASPLLAVGQLVLFNPFAGKSLTTNLTDRRWVGQFQPFILISVADVWGPLRNVQRKDWSAEQEVDIATESTILLAE